MADKLLLVRNLVESARNNLETANQLLQALGVPEAHVPGVKPQSAAGVQRTEQGAVIIEGVFDGQNMVGPDGKLYSVPANYASKSKLVEGDLLKLTISPDGSFIYKQIGPVERERVVGVLARDEQTDDFRVLAKSRFYKVLLASVTYFKAQVGDEVVVLVPKGTPSTWAAVENIIKKGANAAEAGPVVDLPEHKSSGTGAAEPAATVSRPRGRPRKTPAPVSQGAAVAGSPKSAAEAKLSPEQAPPAPLEV
ncbi:MAG: hypothetical protein HY974_01545 [Candidatus Kerfeldbacteria bacterium]|nr:hypothetical protein [Candidatus Kerfeldbacteria bacterium]